MAIYLDEHTRIAIQGITGSTGRTFAERMVADGTPLVAGVTPGKGGINVGGIPVYETMFEAVRAEGVSASLIVTPAPMVRDAFIEAASAGVRLVAVYTEHVPIHDVAVMLAVARQYGVQLLGPNSAGIVSPGKANMSDLCNLPLQPGPVGIVSKSGTLTYEVIDSLHHDGLGESTIVCLGGDPLIGVRYADVLCAFAADPQTEALVLIGEIGGVAEIEAAKTWESLTGHHKPLITYIAGQAAPPGKRMGHAGAIIGGRNESALAKIEHLERAGAYCAQSVLDVSAVVQHVLSNVRDEARTY